MQSVLRILLMRSKFFTILCTTVDTLAIAPLPGTEYINKVYKIIQKSKENYSFSLANPSTDGRKLCTSHIRSYSNSYGINVTNVFTIQARALLAVGFVDPRHAKGDLFGSFKSAKIFSDVFHILSLFQTKFTIIIVALGYVKRLHFGENV